MLLKFASTLFLITTTISFSCAQKKDLHLSHAKSKNHYNLFGDQLSNINPDTI